MSFPVQASRSEAAGASQPEAPLAGATRTPLAGEPAAAPMTAGPTTTEPSGEPVVATPERITALADELLGRIQGSIAEISEINLQARLLSINAQIEAGRAGVAGRSFAVVGQEMVRLSDRTQRAAQAMETQSEVLVRELAAISRELASSVRGTRLCDLAYTNIDLIDRNLYERSCDCRWWATDAAVVAALEEPTAERLAYAAQRLSVILKSYTVYYDIVIADLAGRVIANGREDLNASAGTNQASAAWFRAAMATSSGEQFGFESVHPSPLAGGRRALVYSCRVGQGGQVDAPPVGVLGVVFNWDGLAQTIVDQTPIEPHRRPHTQVAIVDGEGTILVGSANAAAGQRIDLPGLSSILAQAKAATLVDGPGGRKLVAHAQSPGFETYRTGWHSLIVESLGR
jgi:hypothetical protein